MIYIYIQCFWEDFNKPLDIPIFFGQKSKDGKLQNSKFCPPPVPKGEPRVVQNPTAEDFFGFFRVRECHDFSCLGSSKTKTRPKDEQNIFKETTSWIDSISMEFWHCIIAHHELRNAPQGADEPNIPQLIWGFSFTVFQNYVLFQLFFSCDFLELRTKITIPPLLKKGPCKKIPSWISTPPSALFFFSSQDFKDQVPVVIRELTLRKICCVMTLCLGGCQLGPLGSDDGDDGKTRRCGVLWVWGMGWKLVDFLEHDFGT